MEPENNQDSVNETPTQMESNENPGVGRTSTGIATPPQPMSKKGGKNKLPLVLLLIGLAVLIYIIYRGISGGTSEPTVSPTPTLSGPSAPEPSETPEPERADVSIEVLNGTGIGGEAGFLQGELEGLGYTDIEVGNAEEQDNETTTVTFASGLDEAVVDEITALLEELYQDVDVETSSSASTDVSIITGLREGQTPVPSATPSPTASPTASPTSSPTASPSQQLTD